MEVHPPSSTLAQLAELVGGTVVGDPATPIVDATPLNQVAEGEIAFIDLPERLAVATRSAAAALVLPEGLTCDSKPYITVDEVHTAFATIVTHFHPRRAAVRRGISPAAHVDPTAVVGRDVYIGPGASIGEGVVVGDRSTIHPGTQVMPGCKIGNDVTIYPNVTLYEDTIVGDHSILHAGAVIGAYGFGYRQSEGRHVLTAQLGNVEIGSDVEVGANTTIDRATYGTTRIGNGTKLDNLVQIGHNCQIGEHNLLCAQVGIAGSTSTGDYVVMAGQVGVRDHIHVGRGARIGAMAGVANDIPEGISAFGAPAIPERDQKVLIASLAKLPELRKQFKQVRKTVEQLQKVAEESPAFGNNAQVIDPAA